MKRHALLLARFSALLCPALLAGQARGETSDTGAGEILVVALSPLGGGGQEEASAADLETTHALGIGEQLARTAPGMSIAEMQGNPLQPDISYRGFTASPLLGTPQGLSVYVDGVRINQPFGDVVSWDLIPPEAVRSIDLASGAAPQFGRNSLGGALAVRTRDGFSDPGARASIAYGSFGRLTADAGIGGHAESGLHWFLAADHFREDGWRAFSPSRATRAFAKLGWRSGESDVALSTSFADSDLNGNGLQEMRLLATDRAGAYTAPDNTRNHAWLVNLTGRHRLSAALSLSGNLFWRHIDSRTANGDVNDNALGADLYQPDASEQAALAGAGYTGFPATGESQANTPFPQWRCIADALLNTAPNETCDGLFTRSSTLQSEWGGTLELAAAGRLGGMAHHLILGLSYTDNHAHFRQESQFGYLLPNRTVLPVAGPGAYADGTQSSDSAFDARVDLRSRASSLGLYFLDSAELTGRLRLDLAGRYDRTRIHNRDLITPGGGTGSLDGDPVYARFNPAAALNWQAARGLEFTLSFAKASRAPSAVELGCSDPASPCRLPNALAGDPPLRQVIATSFEARAALRRGLFAFSLGAFRTDSHDDILFVTDNALGYGYFRNFGQTRRQGVEATASAKARAWTFSANYTFLDATYRSAETVDGSANASSDAAAPGLSGNMLIRPGDRIPLLPRHLFKAMLGWTPWRRLTLDLDMTAVSGSYARGNENNLHQPDGTYYLGPGRSGGYALFNLGGEFRAKTSLALFFTIRNLFDRHYASAAQLGATAFDASGRFVARPFAGPVIDGERPLTSSTFYAPGAPRSFQIGAKIRF